VFSLTGRMRPSELMELTKAKSERKRQFGKMNSSNNYLKLAPFLSEGISLTEGGILCYRPNGYLRDLLTGWSSFNVFRCSSVCKPTSFLDISKVSNVSIYSATVFIQTTPSLQRRLCHEYATVTRRYDTVRLYNYVT